MRRILVATDRSETADRAVAWAAEMAERYGAELLVLRVLAPGNVQNGGSAREAAAELARLAEQAAGPRGRARVETDDDPSRAICAVASEEGADVVVVGNVDMSGRKEFLRANVPNRVSHNARCTVVIVNTAEPERRRLGRLFGRSG